VDIVIDPTTENTKKKCSDFSKHVKNYMMPTKTNARLDMRMPPDNTAVRGVGADVFFADGASSYVNLPATTPVGDLPKVATREELRAAYERVHANEGNTFAPTEAQKAQGRLAYFDLFT
jgi:hypothetical protein